ncbi:hypothetical protein EfmAA290_32120 (plasmid) [Enterococcus faecium]|nr:hypothetical protein EfmAA290_32120 [Enterococcus faecium]
MTVMRLGEATALTWKDIDFENKNLRVNKTLYYKRAKTYEFVEPETASSIRTIELDDNTITFLKAWKERQVSIGGMSFVLSYNGTPTQKYTILSVEAEQPAKTKIDPTITPITNFFFQSLLISQ